jgi:prolyl-tRNA editing enzyme YbaK/EbsC (Cys-tRNA(Pro) deacylase)
VAKLDADATRKATGFAIGGVPPFGHADRLPVYVDRDLLGYEVVWAAAGRPDSVFAIAPDQLVRLSEGVVSDLAAAPPGSVE